MRSHTRYHHALMHAHMCALIYTTNQPSTTVLFAPFGHLSSVLGHPFLTLFCLIIPLYASIIAFFDFSCTQVMLLWFARVDNHTF